MVSSIASTRNADEIAVVAASVVRGLAYLHQQKQILHRDIKPANILIDERCQVRICDFGLARCVPAACHGESSGNSIRVRNAVLRRKKQGVIDEQKLRD